MYATSARLRFLVLAFAYVAGNFGLPAVDLLLEHRGKPPEERVHFESRGGSSDHGGHCPLNRWLADLRATEAASSETAFYPGHEGGPAQSAPDLHYALRHQPSYRSRAPPSFG